MITREFKKLWHGLASVRDYEIDNGIKAGGMIFVYKGKKMTKTGEELKQFKFQCHAKEFRSKYDNSTYKLYDFKFIDDDEKIIVPSENQMKLI